MFRCIHGEPAGREYLYAETWYETSTIIRWIYKASLAKPAIRAIRIAFQNQGPSIPCKSVYTSFNRDRPYRRCVIQLRTIIHVICFDGNVEWCGSCPSEAQDIPSWFLIRTHPLKKMSLLAREGTAADPPISDHAHPSRDWNWVIFTLSLVPFSALFFSMGAG